MNSSLMELVQRCVETGRCSDAACSTVIGFWFLPVLFSGKIYLAQYKAMEMNVVVG